MKRIYHAMALIALIGFSGFARAQTPETNNNPDAPLAYCGANASFNVQYISSVKVGSIYNITKWSATGYGDYTARWTAMTVGTGYAITINNGFSYTSDQCAVWVDWNKDQDFTDAGEQITVTGTPGLGPYTATITPPTGTAAGTTRMRVRISGQGSFTSCGTTMYGETEDYTVNIGGTPPTTDLGVIDLLTPVTGTTIGSTETVKVRIYNFGTAAQSNFPVSYMVNGGTPVTETVTATVMPGVTYDYTFAQKANMNTVGATYIIQTYTNLIGDQNSANDGVTRTIFHAWTQNQKVVQGEYFINTDPGVGNGTAIAGTYNLVDVTVNITNLNLPVGSRVYVRFKSQNGKWSFPRSFKRESYLSNLNATLAGCEYFVNTDPGQGNGTSTTITSGTANITNLNVTVGSRVYVRVKDSFGRWSKPMGIKRNTWFSNLNATLSYAEYFLNSDPGQGNGTSVSVASGIINLTNLNQPVGTKIYVRVKDSFNRWSQPMGITRQGWYSIQGSTLTYAEYFINMDPGKGSGTPLSITSGNVTIPNLNTPVGSKVYIRVKDSYNRWSQPRGIERLGIYTMTGADLQNGEYFIDTDPGQGNGTPLTFTGGIANLTNFNLPTGSVAYVRVKDTYNRWSYPRGYKRPGIINSKGSDLASVEYFINNDPGHGNGIQLPITSGTVHVDSLILHQHDVVYIRAKDSYNRWGPPKAWKYHFKDFQKAEYKIKLASNGTTTLPLLMQLIPPPDSTCGWIGKKDSVPWHANDTIWARFQDQDGFYTNWKRGVVADAGLDKTICEGGTTTLTATGGGSYLWSTGQAGPSIQVSPGFTAKYWVSVTDGAGGFSSDTVMVVVNPLPFTSGSINGLTEVCAGSTTTVYSVAPVPFATSYLWTLPTGATGTSNTNSIQVTFGASATSGNIIVRGCNSCGQGSGSSLAILVRTSIPGTSGSISGNAIPCKGDNVIYSIVPISNASSYVWTLPSGSTGSSSSNSITVNFGNTAVNGNISVVPINSCGNGTGSSKAITIGVPPLAPSVISGPTEVCAGVTSANYTITPVPTATSYIWTLPPGATGSSVTNSIQVTYGATCVSGNLLVKGINACGAGPNLTTAILVNAAVPSAASVIAGMKDVCAGSAVTTYTTPVISGATSYLWTLPPGATGSSSTNSITVTYTSQATSGFITVKGVNSCGQGQPSSLSVQVNNCAAGAAGIISGPSVVSPGAVSKIYSVEQISNATSYIWTIPQGSSIVSGNNTNCVTINFTDTAVSGIIQVHGANGCGNGLPSPAHYVTVTSLVPSMREVTNVNILNNQTQCYDAIQTVTIAGNNTIFTVENGGQANVIAGENILIKPLTKVYAGGYFHAMITTNGVFCSAQKSFLATAATAIIQDGSSVENSFESDRNIRVYPNPTTRSFTLEFSDADIPLQTKVSIFGMRGDKILEQEAIVTKRMVFSLEGKQPGMYFIQTLRGNRIENAKIIKQ